MRVGGRSRLQDVEYGDGSDPMAADSARVYKRYNTVHRLESSWLNSAAVKDVYGEVYGFKLASASANSPFTNDVIMLRAHRSRGTTDCTSIAGHPV